MARVLAADAERSVLIEADWFWQRVVRGWVAPWLPGSQDQNATMTRALGATVARFAAGGYDVVVEGIVGPGSCPPSWPSCRRASSTTWCSAPTRRPRWPGPWPAPTTALVDEEPIRKMHAAFCDLGELRAPRRRHDRPRRGRHRGGGRDARPAAS